MKLSIHPDVYLLIYGFGQDEKEGRIEKKRLLEMTGTDALDGGDHAPPD